VKKRGFPGREKTGAGAGRTRRAKRRRRSGHLQSGTAGAPGDSHRKRSYKKREVIDNFPLQCYIVNLQGPWKGGNRVEKNVSAQKASAPEGARLYEKNVHQKRTQGSRRQKSERKKAAELLTTAAVWPFFYGRIGLRTVSVYEAVSVYEPPQF
jgi:hypothetical protein